MKHSLVITLKEKHISDIDKIADQFRSEGLEVLRVYPAGIIIGETESESVLKTIMAHDEIEDTPQSEFITKIAPPDSAIQ